MLHVVSRIFAGLRASTIELSVCINLRHDCYGLVDGNLGAYLFRLVGLAFRMSGSLYGNEIMKPM